MYTAGASKSKSIGPGPELKEEVKPNVVVMKLESNGAELGPIKSEDGGLGRDVKAVKSELLSPKEAVTKRVVRRSTRRL